MGKGSAIVWTDNTMNFWVGCVKPPDRPGCANCYAASMAKRAGWDVWGSNKPRRITAAANWKQPLKWDREAREAGKRVRVFAMSLGDFLEDRADLVEARTRACEIIERTTSLDWLILTKRIDNAGLLPWEPRRFPSNVRMGITVENQEIADRDVPKLLALNCKNFVSVEPMLGPIDGLVAPRRCNNGFANCVSWLPRVDWAIVGAESKPGKGIGRPIDLAWVRSVRDQCAEWRVPFMYKQGPVNGALVELPELDGKVWDEVPA